MRRCVQTFDSWCMCAVQRNVGMFGRISRDIGRIYRTSVKLFNIVKVRMKKEEE